jgi:predicted acylesterase/phospholipase RssA
MYGGVSLAIYIYGVTQELFRAVRGRGVYKLLKTLTDSDIVVDVISGTSAGGINGILLGYALCNNRDISSASMLWRVDGDIRRLLRSPRDSIAQSTSLLNSVPYYQSRLETAFRDMASYAPEEGEDPSAFSELDLFVTGTDVDGRLYTQFDDAGHPINVKDHRSIFLLKHRQGRKEPFNPHPSSDPTAQPETTYVALAKLARITSCFPAAFEPVQVENVAAGEATPDAKLQQWGQLGKAACFLDGGVLDNKPFTYTLKAIFSRTADRAVDRKLFYIEPDPETFSTPVEASNPNLVQTVLASMIGIPGYESIADDLKLLKERNSKLMQYQRLVKRLQPECAPSGPVPANPRAPTGDHEAGTSVLYVRSRLVFISERVVHGLLRRGGRDDLLTPEERQRVSALIVQFDQFVDRQLAGPRERIHRLFAAFDVYFRMRRVVRIVYLLYDHLTQRRPPLDPVVARLYKVVWRAFNRQMKLYEVLQAAMENLIDEAPFDWRASSPEQPEELWDLVQAALMKLVDANAEPARRLPQAYTVEYGAGTRDWLSQALLSQLNSALHTQAKGIMAEVAAKQLAPARLDGFRSVLEDVEQYERQILETIVEPDDPIRVAYDKFPELDAQLYPMEMLAGLQEKDIIETIRISPRDADKAFSRSSYADKVSGDALYHFGGFFKRSWRSNDILWGRLDGVCQLVETLVQRDRLQELGDTEETRQRIADRLHTVSALDPAQLFPHAGTKTQESLRVWLSDLFAIEATTRAAALEPKTYAEKIELLIEATQLEVLAEELPNVITDALDEQAGWNQFRVQMAGNVRNVSASPEPDGQPARPAAQEAHGGQEHPQDDMTGRSLATDSGDSALGYDAPSWSFRAPHGRLDPLVAMTGAAEVTRVALASLAIPDEVAPRPSHTALGRFFKQRYQVGAERLTRDIPALVLLEIVAVALRVLQNCVLALFRDSATRIKRHPLYVAFVAAPLRVFHVLVVLMQRAPGWGLGVMLGLAVLCLFALGVGIFLRTDLTMGTLWVFFIGPVVILIIEGIIWLTAAGWLERRERRCRGMYQAAYAKLSQGKYLQAIQGFHKVVQRFPRHELADNAQYGIGEAHLRQAFALQSNGQIDRARQEIRQAVEEFGKVRTQYPRGDTVPAAMYKEAQGYLELQQSAAAQARLQALVEHFPWTDEASRARAQLIATAQPKG